MMKSWVTPPSESPALSMTLSSPSMVVRTCGPNMAVHGAWDKLEELSEKAEDLHPYGNLPKMVKCAFGRAPIHGLIRVYWGPYWGPQTAKGFQFWSKEKVQISPEKALHEFQHDLRPKRLKYPHELQSNLLKRGF